MIAEFATYMLLLMLTYMDCRKRLHIWVQDFCQVIYRCPARILCKTNPVSWNCLYQVHIDVLSGGTLRYIVWSIFGLVYLILFQQTTLHRGFMAIKLMIYTHLHRWMKCVAKRGLLPRTRYSVKPWEFLSQVLYPSMSLFFVKLVFTGKCVKIIYIHSLYFKKYWSHL
jgi:hypothetical protein